MSNTATQKVDTPLSRNTKGEGRIEGAGESGSTKALPAFALVIDDQEAICRVVSMILAALGVESATYLTAEPAIASLDQRRPDIIFLDVSLEQSDAFDVIKGLGEKHYTGIIQLMSGGKQPLLEAIQRLGARHGLAFSRPLQKPFRGEVIREAIVSAGLAREPPGPASPTAVSHG